MNIKEVIKYFYTIINTTQEEFYYNNRGCLERSFKRNTKINGKWYNNVMYYYAEQNPNTSSKYAQMLKTNDWSSKKIGWLWYIHPEAKRRIWLANITPYRVEIINNVVIDANKNWYLEK